MQTEPAVISRADRFRQAAKLHEILELALDDLAVIERDPDYIVSMRTWHSPGITGCAVCLAGAVMARSFEAPLIGNVGPGYYVSDDLVTNKLLALDQLRLGSLRCAWATLHSRPGSEAPEALVLFASYVPPYAHAPGAWWAAMHSILAHLKQLDV